MPKKPQVNPALYLIHTDQKGNKWYALKNPARIPAERALQAWIYTEDSKFGLSREQHKALLAKVNENFNKGDYASAAKIVGVMEAALDLYCTEEILLNLASVYFFLNDESKPIKNSLGQDTYPIYDYIQEEKKKIWQEDLTCKSFFLQSSVQFIQRFSEQPQLNAPEYLEETKQVRELINFYLQRRK